MLTGTLTDGMRAAILAGGGNPYTGGLSMPVLPGLQVSGTVANTLVNRAIGVGRSISVTPSQGGLVSEVRPGNPVGGYRYRPETRPTDVNYTEVSSAINVAANVHTPFELGDVFDIIDGSATALAFNVILAMTPNGRLVDLALLTRTKLGGNFLGSMQTMIPAGTWQFINISGGAVTAKEIWVTHFDVSQ